MTIHAPGIKVIPASKSKILPSPHQIETTRLKVCPTGHNYIPWLCFKATPVFLVSNLRRYTVRRDFVYRGKFTPKLKRDLCKAKNVCLLRVFNWYLVVLREGVDIALYWKLLCSQHMYPEGRLNAAPEVDCHSNAGIFIVACSLRMLGSIDTDSQNCSDNIIAGNKRRWLKHRQKFLASLLDLGDFFRAEPKALWFDSRGHGSFHCCPLLRCNAIIQHRRPYHANDPVESYILMATMIHPSGERPRSSQC